MVQAELPTSKNMLKSKLASTEAGSGATVDSSSFMSSMGMARALSQDGSSIRTTACSTSEKAARNRLNANSFAKHCPENRKVCTQGSRTEGRTYGRTSQPRNALGEKRNKHSFRERKPRLVLTANRVATVSKNFGSRGIGGTRLHQQRAIVEYMPNTKQTTQVKEEQHSRRCNRSSRTHDEPENLRTDTHSFVKKTYEVCPYTTETSGSRTHAMLNKPIGIRVSTCRAGAGEQAAELFPRNTCWCPSRATEKNALLCNRTLKLCSVRGLSLMPGMVEIICCCGVHTKTTTLTPYNKRNYHNMVTAVYSSRPDDTNTGWYCVVRSNKLSPLA